MRYEMTVLIERPIEVVWEFVADVFNVPRLRGQALIFRQTSPGPIGVGTTYEGRVMILGFEARIGGVVTEWDPPRASTATASARPVRFFGVRETLVATAGGTTLTRVIDIEPRSV